MKEGLSRWAYNIPQAGACSFLQCTGLAPFAPEQSLRASASTLRRKPSALTQRGALPQDICVPVSSLQGSPFLVGWPTFTPLNLGPISQTATDP